MAEQAHRRVVLLDSSALKLHLQIQLHALHAVVAFGGRRQKPYLKCPSGVYVGLYFLKDVDSRTSLSKFLWLW